MKSASLMLALVLTLGACSAHQQVGSSAQQGYGEYQPLHARILSTHGGAPLTFHVNRPAYAALFMIVPGAGVSLLYPGFGSGSLDGRVFAGHTGLHGTRLSNLSDYQFASAQYVSDLDWRSSSPYRPGMSLPHLGPRFYFLIASDRPLNVEQFGRFGQGLRRQLGYQFVGLNAYDTMEDLALLSIPTLEEEGSWTTDFYVEWPNVLYDTPRRGLVPFNCNGYRMYVPFHLVQTVRYTLCADRNETVERSDSSTAVGDSTGVQQPGARKPVPPEKAHDTDLQVFKERITSSTQLQRDPDVPWRDGFDRPGRRLVPESEGRRIEPELESRVAPRVGDEPRQPVDREQSPRLDPDSRSRMEPPAPRAEPARQPRVDPPAPRAEPPAPRAEPPAPRIDPPAPRAEPAPAPGGTGSCNPCQLR